MGFEISDEALNALEAAPSEDRLKFLSGLSEDERAQIATAYPAWKAKKGIGNTLKTAGFGPTPSAPPPSFAGAYPSPSEHAAPFTPPNVKQEDFSNITGPIHRTALRGAEAALDSENPIVKAALPSYDLLAHSAFSGIVGDDIMNHMSPEQTKRGTDQLSGILGKFAGMGSVSPGGMPTQHDAAPLTPENEQRMGDTLVPVAQAAASVAPAVPAMFTPLGWGADGAEAVDLALPLVKGASKLRTVGTIAAKLGAEAGGNMLEGAALGTGNALIKGEDPVKAAVGNALFGAGMTGLGAGIRGATELAPQAGKLFSKGAGKLKALTGDALQFAGTKATLVGEDAQNLFNAAEQLSTIPGYDLAVTTAKFNEGTLLTREAKHTDKDFTPSLFTFDRDDNGKVTARILDYSFGAQPKVATLPVNNVKEAGVFREYVNKHNIGGSFKNTEALPPSVQATMVPDVDPYSKAYGDDWWKVWGTKEQVKKDPFWGDAAREPKTTLYGRQNPMPDVDAPPMPPAQQDVRVIVDGNGHMKAVPADSPAALEGGAEPTFTRKPATPGEPGTEANIIPEEVKKGAGGNGASSASDAPKTEARPRKNVYQPVKGYIKNENNESVVVHNIGPDYRNEGHVMVQDGQDNVSSIPEGDFHPALTPEKSLSLVNNSRRVPIDSLAMKGNPKDLQELQDFQSMVKEVVRRNPTVGEKLFGKTGLISPHHLGEDDMRAILRANQGAQSLKQIEVQAVDALVKKAGGKQQLESIMDKDLGQVFEGKKSWNEFEASHAQVTQEFKTLAQNMMQRRDELQKELLQLGVIGTEDLLDGDQVVKYLAKRYYAHMLPKGQWARVAPVDVIDRAAGEIKKSLASQGKLWTDEVITSEVQKILNDSDPEAAFKSSALSDSVYGHLKARQDLPQWLKDAKGEAKSGMVRMATTLATQEQLLAQHKLFHELADNPKYYSHGPQPHLDHRQVPNNPKMYGPLAGGYVAPEIYEHIINLPKAPVVANQMLSSMYSFLKGNNIASVATYMNNHFDGWKSSVMAGGISPFRPHQAAVDLRTSARAVADYMKDPSGKTGLGQIILEMKRYDADWMGNAEVDLGIRNENVRAIFEKLAADKGVDAFSMSEKFYANTLGKYKGVVQKAGHSQDAADRWYRVANYVALKRQFLADPAKFLPNVAPENVMDAAAKLASQRINDSFMRTDKMGQKVQDLARGPVGLMARFLKSRAEEMRMVGMLPQRMMEDPDLKWRMMAWTAVGGALHASLKYGLLGGPDMEQIRRADVNRTNAQRTWSDLTVALPISHGKDVMLYDYGKHFLFGQLLQGHPDDGTFQRFAANTWLGAVEGGAGESGQRQLMAALGLITPTQTQRKPNEGEPGIGNLLEALAREGAAPQQALQIMDAYRKTQYNGMFGTPWDKTDVAIKMLGKGYAGPFSPTSPAGNMESVRNISNYIHQDVSNAGNKSLSKSEIEQRKKAAQDAINREVSKIGNRGPKK